jgi:hypothetical protein
MSDNFDPYYEWLGIRPDEQPADHYRLLGVRRLESDVKLIGAAADQRMTYLRSMQNGPRGSYTQQLLNDVSIAQNCLLDPRTKQAYDDQLEPARQLPPTPQKQVEPEARGYAAVAAPLAQPLAPAAQPVADPQPWNSTAPPPQSPGSIASEDFTVPPVKRRSSSPPQTDDLFDEESGGLAPLWLGAMLLAAVALIATTVWAIGMVIFKAPAEVVTPEDSGVSAANTQQVEPSEGEPVVGAVVLQGGDGVIDLPATIAVLTEDGTDSSAAKRTGRAIRFPHSPTAELSWEIDVAKIGVFEIEITYSTPLEATGGDLMLKTDSATRQLSLRNTGGPTEFVTDTFFIALRSKGEQAISLTPIGDAENEICILRSVRLTPKTGRN